MNQQQQDMPRRASATTHIAVVSLKKGIGALQNNILEHHLQGYPF